MVNHSAHQQEKDLLFQLRSGDEKAFGMVFKEFYPGLCYFATRLIQDDAAAEEIVQDVLYKLWQKHGDFDNLVSIKAFLYISTRNASLNYIDKERRKALRIEDFEATADTFEEPVINEMIYTEALNRLRVEINNLPDQCGKIIKMLFEDDMKPQAIADELNITVSTVYNQKLRGVSLLKKRLSDSSLEFLLVYLILNGLK